MITRLLAAAVGLAVILPAIFYGGELAVEVVVFVASLVCLSEYAQMAFGEDRWVSGIACAVGWGALYGTGLYGPPDAMFVVVSLGVVATLIVQTLRPGDDLERTADLGGRLLLGSAWIAMLGYLVVLRRCDDGMWWMFLVLVISWLGDTGGYFAGKYLGRHKLYPRISPKKTWEGVAGGVTLATMGTFAVRWLGLPDLSVVDCLLLGPLLSLSAVVGDLSESMLKRSFQVKDSGWIMPGHGGLLDRVDSVLFVAPLLYAWVRFVES